MAIISYPVLHFKESFEAFLRYTDKYNNDKPLKQQLRPQHIKLYAKILIQLSRQLHERNKLFKEAPSLRMLDNKEPVKLSTNRKVLSWVESVFKISENSVYRQILRLMKAGVITDKINHGSQMNFELLINPDLLIISSKNSCKNQQQELEKLSAENQQDNPRRSTKFKPNSLFLKEHINNINITVEKVSQTNVCDGVLKEQERTGKNFLKEHREIVKEPDQEKNDTTQKLISSWNLSAKKKKEKEQSLAPEICSKLREHQKAAAKWFFWYVLSCLFENREFNPVHLENTIAYVEENYFINCHSAKDIENTQKRYQWRIDKAKKSIKRHNINMQWIFPGKYLDRNNKGINSQTGKSYMSFENTSGWFKKYEKLQKQKKTSHKESANLFLLQKQIRLYMENPSLEQFRRNEAYIKKNIPGLMDEFLNHFTTTKLQAHA